MVPFVPENKSNTIKPQTLRTAETLTCVKYQVQPIFPWKRGNSSYLPVGRAGNSSGLSGFGAKCSSWWGKRDITPQTPGQAGCSLETNLVLHWSGPFRTTTGNNRAPPASTTASRSIQTPKVDVQRGGDIIHRFTEEVAVIIHVIHGPCQFLRLQTVKMEN